MCIWYVTMVLILCNEVEAILQLDQTFHVCAKGPFMQGQSRLQSAYKFACDMTLVI